MLVPNIRVEDSSNEKCMLILGDGVKNPSNRYCLLVPRDGQADSSGEKIAARRIENILRANHAAYFKLH